MNFRVIGKVLPRKDAVAKVCGREAFASDVVIPNMLHAVTLRSPYPHADIVGIDTSAAEAMGAVCLVPDDVPDFIYNERTVSIPEKTYRDRRVLPRRARHVGEAIAAVAAETEELAFRALQALKVEYRVLPAVLDAEFAMSPAAAPLYEEVLLGDETVKVNSNIACERNIVIGDPAAGFAKADYVIEREYSLPRVYHLQMEPKTAVCQPEHDGGVTLWVTTQTIHNVRQLVGQIFDIPLSKVNVKKMALGGSFGSSIQMNSIIPICTALALKAGQPVKLVSSREDDMYDHVKFPAKIRLKVGVTKDARIVAAEMNALVDIGAHQVNAYPLLGCMAGWYASLYKWQDFSFAGKSVYTNKVPACAMQGYGNPQVNFAVESHIDIIAHECGFDPVEFRRKNYVGTGDEFWGQGPTVKSIIKSCGVEEMLAVGAAKPNWRGRQSPAAKSGRYRRGIGVARGFHTSGTGGPKPGEVIDYSSATVKINEDGSVDVLTPVMDLGGGTGEAAVKIVAEVLQLPYDKVDLARVDTRTTGYDVNTHATRGVYCGCGAVLHVARQVRRKLLEYAGRILDEDPEILDLAFIPAENATVVQVKGYERKRLTIGEVAKLAQIYSWGTIAATDSYRQKNCPPCFVTHFIEVEVDTRTGIVRVPKALMLSDSGTPINPDMLAGQLIGSLSRGLGYAAYESTENDPATGHLECRGFVTDNKIPTSCEMPLRENLEVYFADTYEPTGPFGAKGIGEAALNSVASAYANAVYNAIGVRFYELPITPERVLAALTGGGTHADRQ
ncbi:xanthine dehydrogenase family protein molybdopterin-binding subunit [Anaeroselena agilis]|uniref:Molybdopterin-dependent oxidoreductase n=1 Tax=Anaeroselena agilis TaxID=3063788 RepID=A0ABU3P1W2_9FIRM|nr:molybdopterin-dependent oxidoreductase [Selenomonadales bacterium 4137-cl]